MQQQRRKSRLGRFARLAAIIFVAVIGLAIILAVIGSIIDTADDETTALATPTASPTSATPVLTPASVPTPAPAAPIASIPTAVPASPTAALVSTTPPVSPTPTQAADDEFLTTYTAEELLACDTTTLARQQYGRALPGELLSDCEVALQIAQLNTVGFLLPENTPLSQEQHAMLMEHVGNIDEMDREIRNLDINTNQDIKLVCDRDLPTWSKQAREANAYRESLAAPELLGWEMDLVRTLRFLNAQEKICSDLAGESTAPNRLLGTAIATRTHLLSESRVDLDDLTYSNIVLKTVQAVTTPVEQWDEVTATDVQRVCRGVLAVGTGPEGQHELIWELLTERDVTILGTLMALTDENEMRLEIYCTNQLR